MKLLILSVLALASGAGWLGMRSARPASNASDVGGSALAAECHPKVECTPEGTCVITCYDDAGNICCQKEVDCDCAGSACPPGQDDCESECAPADCGPKAGCEESCAGD